MLFFKKFSLVSSKHDIFSDDYIHHISEKWAKKLLVLREQHSNNVNIQKSINNNKNEVKK